MDGDKREWRLRAFLGRRYARGAPLGIRILRRSSTAGTPTRPPMPSPVLRKSSPPRTRNPSREHSTSRASHAGFRDGGDEPSKDPLPSRTSLRRREHVLGASSRRPVAGATLPNLHPRTHAAASAARITRFSIKQPLCPNGRTWGCQAAYTGSIGSPRRSPNRRRRLPDKGSPAGTRPTPGSVAVPP